MAPSPFDEIIGESSAIRAMRDSARRILARIDRDRRLPPLVVIGEGGSGKGLVARVMHRAGPRAGRLFVDFYTPSVPDALQEFELFGFVRGAFPGAVQGRPGRIQCAHRGVMFLDQMAEMADELQAKVVETAELGVARRIKGTRDERIDIWLIASGYEEPEVLRSVRSLVLRVPPLRERDDDVLLLADHYLRRFCREYGVPEKTLSRGARAALMAHRWPGNVRELMNMVERAVILASELIQPTDLGFRSGAA